MKNKKEDEVREENWNNEKNCREIKTRCKCGAIPAIP